MAQKFGTIRLGNKRKDSPHKPKPGEVVIDIDRVNPVLGNRHILHNHRDPKERAQVIADHKVDFQKDMEKKGPMYDALQNIAKQLEEGKNIILMCWCHDRPCHGNTYIEKIYDMIKERNPDFVKPSKPKPPQQSLFSLE
jgi:hypothetical protein